MPVIIKPISAPVTNRGKFFDVVQRYIDTHYEVASMFDSLSDPNGVSDSVKMWLADLGY